MSRKERKKEPCLGEEKKKKKKTLGKRKFYYSTDRIPNLFTENIIALTHCILHILKKWN